MSKRPPRRLRGQKGEDMKKIIDGKMYNTETAKKLAITITGHTEDFHILRRLCTERKLGSSSCTVRAMQIADIANAGTVIRQALRKSSHTPKKRRKSGWSRTQAPKSISRSLVNQTNDLNTNKTAGVQLAVFLYLFSDIQP